MPNLHTFVVDGPDSSYAREFPPPPELDTISGGPARWGNNYFDLLSWDGDWPTGYPGNGSTIKYYWHRYYIQTSTGEGFDFSCVDENYNQNDPEYTQSPYTRFTLPPRNHPAPTSGGWLTWVYFTMEWSPVMEEWELSSYSTEWVSTTYTGLWLPQYHNQDGHILIAYSTEDVYVNGERVLTPDDFYAEKETTDGVFGFKFGVLANDSSARHEPDEDCIVPYFYTQKYTIGLDFTTAAVYDPDDGHLIRDTHAYSLSPSQIMEILGSAGYESIEQRVRFSSYMGGDANYRCYITHLPGLGYTQSIAGLNDATLPQFLIENADYAMLEVFPTVNILTIAQIKDYMIEEDLDVEGLTDNAMFVSYDINFYDESGNIAKTLTVDYSDLHGNGLDLEGNDGGDTEWHNSTDSDDPSNNIDTSKIGATPLANPTLSGAGAFSNFWFMNKNELGELNDILNVDRNDRWESIKELTVLMGERPFDCLLDVKMYPFDVNQLNTGKTTQSHVAIGGYLSDLQSMKLTGSPVGCKRLGGKFIKPEFDNYLDYEPYTQYLLYVPYVGFMELDATTITGTKLTVDFITDITTGACCVVAMADEKVVAYRQGTVGVTVPLTGQAASLNQLKDAGGITGHAGLLFSGLAAATTAVNPAAGIITAALGGVGIAKDVVEQYVPTSVLMNQASGQCSNPACNNYMPQSVYLYKIISEPALKKEDYYAYGRTTGWAVAKKARVSDYSANSGIVHATIVDPRALTSSAYASNCPMITEAELKEIEEIFAKGFYGVDTTVQQ